MLVLNVLAEQPPAVGPRATAPLGPPCSHPAPLQHVWPPAPAAQSFVQFDFKVSEDRIATALLSRKPAQALVHPSGKK